ncbi:MAG: M1 family metallopeptidase [Gemmatimonadota bacterium]|nr:M1 family metallopeptidase [Gemmatimonadota bacterium]
MRPLWFSLLLAAPLAAQNPPAPPTPAAPGQRPAPTQRELRSPVADTGIFSPLPLPEPNDLRRANGAPGRGYWQQRADYVIQATLDTTARRLSGKVAIRYSNNSPDTLARIWLQLDQNLFRKGSVGSYLNPQESRFGGANFDGGFEIAAVLATLEPPRGRPAPARSAAAKTRVDDTMMEVVLPFPLPPGRVATLSLDFAFNIPDHGADRMGRDGALYELAQWYPRVCVYDDVNGWNTLQYLGQGEFYLEYGDFEYDITVPAGYIVAGTGMIQNPLEVLTATQRARLAAAVRSDTVVRIVTEAELQSGAARPRRDGMLTWRFKARDVRDVAWAASPEYLWDATGWDGILAQAYYRPSAKELWHEAAKMSQYSIREYSGRWPRYPYPQISAVEGPVSGMEYPMVAMEAKDETREGLYSVVTHEIGHMWYPMIVGSDERRYPWMDEGFDTFINIFSEEGYFTRDDSRRRRGEGMFVLLNDQAPTAQPIMTYANRFRTDENLGALAYIKPAMGLSVLRNKVLGAEVFDAAFREYTRRWAFKHPQPADFFRTFEDVSGQDLDWFWRGWFYTTAALDQTVESVTQRAGQATVVIRNRGQLVLPVELTLTYGDGTSEVRRLPVEIWYKGDKYTAVITTDKTVTAAQVNADGQFPDVNPRNDGWKAGS